MKLLKEYDEWSIRIMRGEKHPDKAKQILFSLVNDFADRRGLRQEWDQIDSDIQDEILHEWLEIIQQGMK